MMPSVLPVYKPLGLTPLQAITLLKQQFPQYQSSRIGYAGRLDPMAEGLLLLLLDDENKKHKEYEVLPKEYEFEVLFGISTDSYDLLGLITQSMNKLMTSDQRLTSNVQNLLPSFLGKQQQTYPPYSSRTVQGKPLYKWAREGKLAEITIPERMIELYSFELLSSSLLPVKKLEQTVFERIQKVTGEFRQQEIRSSWQYFLTTTPLSHFPVFRFRATCSSGTYVRVIAHNFGQHLRAGALAYSIKRTVIGPYTLKDAVKFN